MKKSMVSYVCSGSNPTAWMAAAPRMQITEPPRYVFTTGMVFPSVLSPAPSTIRRIRAPARPFGRHPVYMQTVTRSRVSR